MHARSPIPKISTYFTRKSNKMRRVAGFTLLFYFLQTFVGYGQDVGQAYGFSNLQPLGTARSIGFGNALGSVGGDIASVSVNPAGIGVYRTSEITITPSLKLCNSGSSYVSGNTAAQSVVSNVNSFNILFTNAPKGRRYERRKWKTITVAIGMNRIADFNRSFAYQGTNKTSTAAQVFESDANLHPGNDTTSGTPAYMGSQGNLLVDSMGHFFIKVPYKLGLLQNNTVNQGGGINEYLLSAGGNYKEKLLVGVTFGVPYINYQRNEAYNETYNGSYIGNNYSFSSFFYSGNLNVTGLGLNMKIGAIYKITQALRIGLAIHGPTYYTLSDNLGQGITSRFGDSVTAISTANLLPVNSFNYNLTTPWKAVLSATWLIRSPTRNFGFITADFERVNYSTMHYKYPGGYDYSNGENYQAEQGQLNAAVEATYQATSNVRVGMELILTRYLLVRCGAGFYGNPYQSSTKMNGQRTDISAGLGYHFNHFFADLGWMHSIYTSYDQPYNIDFNGIVSGTPTAVPVATINYVLDNVALTLGVKF